MLKVKDALKDTYNVEASKSASKKLLPKIKIFDIDTDIYTKSSSSKLKDDLLQKNKEIQDIIHTISGSIFEILFINEDHHFAVIKTTEKIRQVIKNKGNRLFLNLTSCNVKDDFHLLQCFKCQKFGHKVDSPHCSGLQVCLYCSEDHRSKDCPVKGKNENHVCANCKIHPVHKTEAHGHKSNSPDCPLVVKETEVIMKRTAGITNNDFLKYRAKLQAYQVKKR